MYCDTEKDVEKLKHLIGKTIVDIELWGYCFKKRKWIKDEEPSNVTLILNDGTMIQGVDGEYGENRIEVINNLYTNGILREG
jgi:hypothetical protein